MAWLFFVFENMDPKKNGKGKESLQKTRGENNNNRRGSFFHCFLNVTTWPTTQKTKKNQEQQHKGHVQYLWNTLFNVWQHGFRIRFFFFVFKTGFCSCSKSNYAAWFAILFFFMCDNADSPKKNYSKKDFCSTSLCSKGCYATWHAAFLFYVWHCGLKKKMKVIKGNSSRHSCSMHMTLFLMCDNRGALERKIN